jgi:hypothetical protein
MAAVMRARARDPLTAISDRSLNVLAYAAISRAWVSVSQPETSSTLTCLSSKIQKFSTGQTA